MKENRSYLSICEQGNKYYQTYLDPEKMDRCLISKSLKQCFTQTSRKVGDRSWQLLDSLWIRGTGKDIKERYSISDGIIPKNLMNKLLDIVVVFDATEYDPNDCYINRIFTLPVLVGISGSGHMEYMYTSLFDSPYYGGEVIYVAFESEGGTEALKKVSRDIGRGK